MRTKLGKVYVYSAAALLLWMAGISWAPRAFGQLPTGTISGVVKDSTGAVVPDATVTATNTETGTSRSGQSSNIGAYRFPALAVGTYEVKVEHAGFQTSLQQGLQLVVGQEAVLNFTLEVGAVAETVSVTAEAPIVDTTSGTLGNVVNSQTLEDLPLNGRNWNDLTLLQTGVSQDRNTDSSGILNGTIMTINGAPIRSNLFTMDGTIMNDAMGVGAASVNENTTGAEAIREYKVVTNAFSAEYGMTMGGQVQIVTKGGTNNIHGSLFEYLRNSDADAHGWSPKAPTKRNNFGASVGGPIKKDKLFYFMTYEGLRQSTQSINSFVTVPQTQYLVDGPTVAAYMGASGESRTTISPAVKPYLQYWPAPNGPDPQGRTGFGQFNYAIAAPQTEDYGMGRVDFMVTSKDSLFGRYSIDNSDQFQPTWLPQNASAYPLAGSGFTVPSVTQDDPDRNQYFTLSDNHIFSPSLLSTMRGSFSRTHFIAGISQNLPTSLDFGTAYALMGTLGITGITDYSSPLGGPTNTEANQRIFSVSDDLFYTPGGKHSFKFGTLINWYRQFVKNNGGNSPYGTWAFTSLADFLAANPSSFSEETAGSNPSRTFDYDTLGFYVQDDIKLKPTLTLNLGLRYEFSTTVNEIRGLGSAVENIVTDASAHVPDIPFINPSEKDISPRFGLAWDVRGDGKTSVRAGFAKLYDIGVMGTSLFIFSSGTPPYTTIASAAKASNQVVPAFGPFPTLPSGLGATRLRTIDYHLQQPALYSFNFAIERQLPWEMGLGIAYAGSRGEHLIQNIEGNPFFAAGTPVNGACVNTGTVPANNAPKCFLGNEIRRNPAWGTVEYRPGAGDSWYNSLQVNLQKRLAKGVQFQSSYTYSKEEDDTQGQLGFDTSGGGGGGVGDPTNGHYDKSPGNFDLRHNWKFNAIYRMPFAYNGFLGKLANGWWTSGVLTVRSGDPFTVTGDSASIAGGNGDTRANLVPGANVNSLTSGTSKGCSFNGTTQAAAGTALGTQQLFFDPCAFSLPTPGFLGTEGRNILYGPSFMNLDFSLVKDTRLPKLGESGTLQIRVEAFNILNHASWGIPNSSLYTFSGGSGTGALFHGGTVVANTGAGVITTEVSKPRTLQFALRIAF